MKTNTIAIFRKNGWSLDDCNKRLHFFDSNITSNCTKDAKSLGLTLDWVYLDYCGVVDYDVWAELHDNWDINVFARDAEISITSNHKLRAATRRLKPVLTTLSKYADRVNGYFRDIRGTQTDGRNIVLGTQVAVAYCLPFASVVLESVTYGRGMTTTRITRKAGAKRFKGVKMIIDKALKTANKPKTSVPAWFAQTLPAGTSKRVIGSKWAWDSRNPNGLRK